MRKIDIATYRLCYTTAAAALFAGLSVGPAFAQTQGDTPGSVAGPAVGNAQDNEAQDIVVTAQRRSERVTEVPISIQAVGEAALKTSAATNTLDLLKLTPSVTFTSSYSPATTGVTIRGVSSLALEGGVQPSTAVIVDGVPLARQGEFLSDFADTSRIEVLRGPQGTLFGKNATAGAIQIVNNVPTSKYEGSIEAGYTTDNEFLIRGVANIPVLDTVRSRFAVFHRKRDNIVPNIDPNPRGDEFDGGGSADDWGASGKLAIDFSPDITLLLSGDYFSQKENGGGIVGLVPSLASRDGTPDGLGMLQLLYNSIATNPDKPRYNSDAPNLTKVTGGGGSANLSVQLGGGLTLNSITALRFYNSDSYTDADFGPWGAVAGAGFVGPSYPIRYVYKGGLPRGPNNTHYFSQEVRVNYSSSSLEVVAGGYMQLLHNTAENTVPLLLGFSPVPNSGYLDDVVDARIKDNIFSIFGDATWHFTEAFSAFGGLRFSDETLSNQYSRQSWFGGAGDLYDPVSFEPTTPPDETVAFDAEKKTKNLSGRVGLKYAPDSRHNYYLSYNRGYKGPAADVSRSADSTNAFLRPEIADAFEVGTKHVLLGNKLITNIAVFYQTVKDVQQSATIAGSTQTRLQNAGDLRSYGAELDITARLASQLRVDAGATYVHAEYRGLTNLCFPFQTAAEGCNLATGTQDLTGKQAQAAPRFSGNVSATYDIALPAMPFDAFVRAGYSYQSTVQYGLTNDPLNRQSGHGSLDVTLGLIGKKDHWQVLIYGKNLLNEHYYGYLLASNGFNVRVGGIVPRDYKPYGGLLLKTAF